MVPVFDLASTEKMPNLHTNGVVVPADFVAQYWTPGDGEVKRGLIQDISVEQFPDRQDPKKMVEVKVVKLIAQNEDGTWHNIMSGSKRLVSVIEQAIRRGFIKTGYPVEITFKGEMVNKTNSNKSFQWSVKPLKVVDNE
jgi:hypothetical protein